MSIEEEANNVRIGVLGFFGPVVTYVSSFWGHRSEAHRTEQAIAKAKAEDGEEARIARQVKSTLMEFDVAKNNFSSTFTEAEQEVANFSHAVDSLNSTLDAAEQHSFTDAEFGIKSLLEKSVKEKKAINNAAHQSKALTTKEAQAKGGRGPTKTGHKSPNQDSKPKKGKARDKKRTVTRSENTGPEGKF